MKVRAKGSMSTKQREANRKRFWPIALRAAIHWVNHPSDPRGARNGPGMPSCSALVMASTSLFALVRLFGKSGCQWSRSLFPSFPAAPGQAGTMADTRRRTVTRICDFTGLMDPECSPPRVHTAVPVPKPGSTLDHGPAPSTTTRAPFPFCGRQASEQRAQAHCGF